MAKKTTSKDGSGGAKSESGPKSASDASSGPSSSTPYIIGILLFAAGIGGLLYARSSDGPAPAPAPQANASPKPVTEPAGADLPEFAPPPPPEKDAGTDAGEDAGGAGQATAKGDSSGSKRPAGPVGACSSCGKGKASSALVSAVRGTAGTAQGCHNRALRSGGVAGRMNVSVSVGATGGVCGAAITSDSVGNPALSSCVLGKFRSRSYPKPESGCVVINVPLNFTVK